MSSTSAATPHGLSVSQRATPDLSIHETDRNGLTRDDVQPLFDTVGAHVDNFRLLSSGLNSSAYMADCGSAEYILKVYSEPRLVSEQEFETSVLEFLAENNIAVEEPISLTTQDSVVKGLQVSLYCPLPGRPCQRADLSPALAYNTGLYLAGMQDALRDFTPAGERPRYDLAYAFPYVVQQINERIGSDNPAAAARLNRMFVEACHSFVADDFPIGVVHGDIFPGNLHVSGNQVIGLKGFDDAYVGTMLFDLATAAMEFSFDGVATLSEELLSTFIAGYESPGQLIDMDLLIEAMWFSCFRLFGYSLAATAGQPTGSEVPAQRDWRMCTHYRRLELLSHSRYRKQVAARVRDNIERIEAQGGPVS